MAYGIGNIAKLSVPRTRGDPFQGGGNVQFNVSVPRTRG